jgi:hypothetical protein
MSAPRGANAGSEPGGGLVLFLGAMRLAIGVAVAFTGVVGLQSGLACHYDWAVIGASILMLAWSARWFLSAAAEVMRAAAARLRRTADLVHTVGLVAAALLFAGQTFTEQWWPFGWWPLAVGVLLGVVAVVYVRDFARAA